MLSRFTPRRFLVVPTLRRRKSASLLLALAACTLAACDGSNGWKNPVDTGGNNGGSGGGTSTPDAQKPSVVIQFPDSAGTTVAIGDSVYVKVRATDDVRLDSIVISGFALRGDPALGTQTQAARFFSKTVNLKGLSAAVKDTTLQRYLLPTADNAPERNVLIVVAAYDSMRNVGADSAKVNLGGPKITIVAPTAGTPFKAGTTLPVRVQAVDSADLVRSVRVRATGAFTVDSTISFTTPRALVDTTIVFAVPVVTPGTETIQATVVSGANLVGAARPVDVPVTAPSADTQAPRTTFDATFPARVETDDSVRVDVSALDDNRIDTLGVTVLALHVRPGGVDTLAVLTRKSRTAADSMFFSMAGVPLTGLDTLTLRLEVTAWATDPQGNCGAAVSPGTAQTAPCRIVKGARVADVSGRLYSVLVVRGLTVPPPNAGDLLADLIVDSTRVFMSNYTRNRVEVLPIGGFTYQAPVRVGSQPWGLALGRTRDSLYVANSGGTNISVVPLRSAVLAEAQDRRIFTQNEKLYSVQFDPLTLDTRTVISFDYSDRPQFVAQASNGLLVYSTRPTAAATDGTVRIYDPRKTRSEIFTGYVDRHTAGRAIVVNADSAFVTPAGKTMVCPRPRYGDTAIPRCIIGTPPAVSDTLTMMRALPRNASGGRWDTRLDIGASIAEVGLSDTTFVAVSGDRNYVAVGEGARSNARLPLFNAPIGGDSLVLVGDVRDLISNTAERVIGLGLNGDGSLGVARGNQAYYFNSTLRLQGVVAAGSPTGGVAMHPDNVGYPNGSFRLSFVSGIDATAPYVDVIDNFNFFRVKRLYTRDPVIGAIAMSVRAPGDAAAVQLRVYALTTTGILALQVTTTDLTP